MKRGLDGRYVPSITDFEKFISLYFKLVPYSRMAEEFGVTEICIVQTARRLKLPKRGQLHRMIKRQREDKKRARIIKDFLENHGVTNISKLKELIGVSSCLRVLTANADMFLKLDISWSGAYRGRGGVKKTSRYIKHKFIGKTFVALKRNRTQIMRFVLTIFKRNREYGQYDAKTIFQWLKRFGLSRAEKTAIITNLGYIYKSRQHMMINGYIDNPPSPNTISKKALEQLLENIEVA